MGASSLNDKAMSRLRTLVNGGHAAVLTMELQEGVVGREALMQSLVEAVDAGGLRGIAGEVCAEARRRNVPVVHCVAENRPDGRGASDNCAVFAMNNRLRRDTGRTPIDIGSPGAALIPELGPEPDDLVVSRIHGLTPFTQTSLDQILRNLGVDTVIVVGVSVNIGIMGTVISAVDLGYNVVLVRDGVCGVPREYADAVLEHTMPLLATVVTSADLRAAWG
ncbi:MAG: cysteine hydrolase [Actinomycetota bacterium]